MSLTKFADTVRGVKDVAAKADGSKQRLDAINAAAVSTNKRTSGAYKTATAGLAKLGYSIDQIAASGSIADLEEKMKKHRWTATQKIALKMCLGICGAI
jgi:hypothetical protein